MAVIIITVHAGNFDRFCSLSLSLHYAPEHATMIFLESHRFTLVQNGSISAGRCSLREE